MTEQMPLKHSTKQYIICSSSHAKNSRIRTPDRYLRQCRCGKLRFVVRAVELQFVTPGTFLIYCSNIFGFRVKRFQLQK